MKNKDKNVIFIIIEKSSDHYSAYAKNVEGVFGAGDTVEDAKQSVLNAIQVLKENNSPEKLPDILKEEYGVVYYMIEDHHLSYEDIFDSEEEFIEYVKATECMREFWNYESTEEEKAFSRELKKIIKQERNK